MGAWSDDAKAAMLATPDYFLWWYTAKSLALVAAVAAVAYYVGKEHGRRA
jgi:hypothetical protein